MIDLDIKKNDGEYLVNPKYSATLQHLDQEIKKAKSDIED